MCKRGREVEGTKRDKRDINREKNKRRMTGRSKQRIGSGNERIQRDKETKKVTEKNKENVRSEGARKAREWDWQTKRNAGRSEQADGSSPSSQGRRAARRQALFACVLSAPWWRAE